MRRFVPITRKINFIVILSLVAGIGVVIVYFAFTQNLNLRETNSENLNQQSEVLYQSIKNAMLPGDAPVAVQLFTDIRMINPANEIMLYRANGVEAFSDNSTIETVNANLGRQFFKLKEVFPKNRMIAENDANFSRAVNERRNILYQTEAGGKTYVQLYKTLLNLPKCTPCHGSNHTVRGVISITTDITEVVNEQRANVFIAGAFFVAMVLVLTVLLTRFLHGALVRPVKHIGEVCATVTKGDFNAKVNLKNRDEIGALGETVNKMVEGLFERFQLSKFVSSSTLRSIKNRERGAKTDMTLFFSDIRSFTTFSEKNVPETVVESLNRVLNVQTDIIHRNGGDVDKYVGDAILAIFSGERSEEYACRTAVEIQKELLRSKELYRGLAVGIGINCGEVILGLVGSEARADFTVIGDHVNVASRLCGKAKPGMILISQSVYERVRSAARARGPFRLRVKGKEEFLDVYQLLAIKRKAA